MNVDKNIKKLNNMTESDVIELMCRLQSKNEALIMDNEQLHSDIVNLNCNLDHITQLLELEKEKNKSLEVEIRDKNRYIKTLKDDLNLLNEDLDFKTEEIRNISEKLSKKLKMEVKS